MFIKAVAVMMLVCLALTGIVVALKRRPGIR